MKPNHKAGMELETIEEQQQALTVVRAAQVRVKLDDDLPHEDAARFVDLAEAIEPSIAEERKRLQLDSKQKAALMDAAELATMNTVYAEGVVDSYRAIHGIPREEALKRMSDSDELLFKSNALMAGIGHYVTEFSRMLTVAA